MGIMGLLGNSIFLCAVTLVAGQTVYDQQKLNSSKDDFKYDQISKILKAPMFRSDPAIATAAEISSYLPQTYDSTGSKEIAEETKTTPGSYLFPLPSLVLKPPRAEAANVYASPKSYLQPIQAYSPYQPQPQIQPQSQLQSQSVILVRPQNFQGPYIPISMTDFAPKYPEQDTKQFMPINPLSKQLDLPLPDSQPKIPNFAYPLVPSTELQTPQVEPNNQQYDPNPHALTSQYIVQPQNPNLYNVLPQIDAEVPYPALSQSLETPKSESIKPINIIPTKYYPKKYNPDADDHRPKKASKKIPVIELVGDELVDITKIKKSGKPQKITYDPNEADRIDEGSLDSYLKNQAREKQKQKFEESQLKRKSRKENESRKQQQFVDKTIARASVANSEPVASETGFNTYHHGGNSFAAPAQHSGVGVGGAGLGLGGVSHEGSAAHHGHEGHGERTEFQMHGQHGPHSYKFGFDTGKGKNRQFRYEERNNEGIVKGHYGFYDKHGKLQVVNYDAHPHHGFHAEGSFGRV